MQYDFDIHIHHEIITTIKLINIFITSGSYHVCVCVCVCVCKINPLWKLQVYKKVLFTIVKLLYVRSLEVTHFIKIETLHPLINISPSALPPDPGNHLYQVIKVDSA